MMVAKKDKTPTRPEKSTTAFLRESGTLVSRKLLLVFVGGMVVVGPAGLVIW